MKQIILIRHAKVDIDNTQKIDSLSLQSWVEEYDIAPIHVESLPSAKTVHLIKNADVALTSTLQRAIDSAKVLGVEVIEESSLFNEAAIPKVNIPFFKLRPKSWLIVLRVLLLLRLGNKDTSLKYSKIQAKKAVEKLVSYTEEHNTVILVGHGGMNWLIRQILLKYGWTLESKPSNKNWGVTILKN